MTSTGTGTESPDHQAFRAFCAWWGVEMVVTRLAKPVFIHPIFYVPAGYTPAQQGELGAILVQQFFSKNQEAA